MKNKLSRGAKIVVDRWLEIKAKEALLIVTCEKHKREAEEIMHYAKQRHAKVEILSFPDQKGQVGHYFDEHEDAFDAYDVILGATTHSLVTTRAVKRAIERGSRFLSLPLSTNDSRSMLEYDFLLMDTKISKRMGDYLVQMLNQTDCIRVVTAAGTDLTFAKQGRDAKFFNGSTTLCNGYASSSFEVYVPIEENATDLKLKSYLEAFEDEGMYVAGEFGIGLNQHSNCRGHCYIEDESTYGTFHIGFGRNIALGGVHHAKAHFDLVFHKPDIYAGDIRIMKQGEIEYHSEFKSEDYMEDDYGTPAFALN